MASLMTCRLFALSKYLKQDLMLKCLLKAGNNKQIATSYLRRGFSNSRSLSSCGDKCPKERQNVDKDSKVNSPHTNMCMPALLLGTWNTNKVEVAEVALTAAFTIGYRGLDTSAHYGNEMVLGFAMESALCAAGLKREDIFIIAKLPFDAMDCEKVKKSLCRSLRMLRTSYADLYMINFPAGSCKDDKGNYKADPNVDHKAIWKGMEEMVEIGKAKYIGLGNFNCEQLSAVLDCAKIMPSNLQVEMHAYFQQKQYRQYAKELGITISAYAPAGRSKTLIKWLEEKGEKSEKPNPIDDPAIAAIAKKKEVSPHLILLRYLLQLDDNVAVILGASNPKIICSNFQVFDICIGAEDMCKLRGLDKGKEGRLFDKSLFKHHFPGVENSPHYPWKEA